MNKEEFEPIRFLNYLKYRADHQGVPLALDEGFIMESFHVGVRYFLEFLLMIRECQFMIGNSLTRVF